MTLDGGWALIISGVLVLFLTGVAVLVWRHVDNSQADADAAHAEIAVLKEKIAEASAVSSAKIAEVALDIVRHQRHVAENYAKIGALERIESKLDRLLERNGEHHG